MEFAFSLPAHEKIRNENGEYFQEYNDFCSGCPAKRSYTEQSTDVVLHWINDLIVMRISKNPINVGFKIANSVVKCPGHLIIFAG